jgi:hypothetical protein
MSADANYIFELPRSKSLHRPLSRVCDYCKIPLSPASFFRGSLCGCCEGIESSLTQTGYWLDLEEQDRLENIARIQHVRKLLQGGDAEDCAQ